MSVYDFSFSRPSVDELLAAGATGVARYLSSYTTNKNADRAELESYWAAGLAVLLVWENDTHDSDGGYQAGANAGHAARPQASGLGFPVDHVLYWAVDRRLNDAQRAAAIEYGRGFRDAAGLSRPYGEGALIDAAVAADLCDGGWMPDTWGPCNHVVLLQRTTPSPLAGTDHNDPKSDDWGGYLPTVAPVPTPTPEDDEMASPAQDAEAITQAVLNLYECARGVTFAGDKGAPWWAAEILAGRQTIGALAAALANA